MNNANLLISKGFYTKYTDITWYVLANRPQRYNLGFPWLVCAMKPNFVQQIKRGIGIPTVWMGSTTSKGVNCIDSINGINSINEFEPTLIRYPIYQSTMTHDTTKYWYQTFASIVIIWYDRVTNYSRASS